MFVAAIIHALLLLAYYALFCALIPMLMKSVFRLPDEYPRKFQHISYAMSILLIILIAESWYYAIFASAILILFAFPFLFFLERTQWYPKNFVDRDIKGGEMRRSMLLVQLSYIILITVFWGILGEGYRYLIVIAVITWGYGDAAAALFGKAFGKTKIHVILVDPSKTWFGSNAMTLAALVTLFLMLFFYARFNWYVSLLIALIVAPVSSALELFSKKGTDTLFVPVGTAVTLYIWVLIFTRVGWIS
ncbi:MAG: diacylglycerol/polyprenol kinase family protein [Acholeplasmataceae bacterium]